MRALKIAGAAIAAVIIVAALLLIVGVPTGFLTSEIQARVERETGYRLTIAGSTRIGVWPSLNVSLSDVTLEAPKDRDNGPRVTVGSVQADITLKSLWAGHPQITAIEIVHPVLYAPLLRERDPQASAASKPAKAASEGDANAPTIDRVTITDGAVVFHNLRDRVENRLDAINADVRIGGDRKITVKGSARASDHPLKFEIKAIAPVPPIERQNIPVELTFEAPGVLQAPLSARAEARLNGMVVMINGVSGTLGDSAFNGWASVDGASKPLVKLDLDFQRLDVGLAKSSGTSQGTQPWSNATIDLNGLNYVDAQIRISAAELDIGDARLAPAAIDATLESGLLKASFPNLRAYGGLISGQIAIDASSGNPAYALACDLVGVRALPLLQSGADFDKLDGKMQAKISTRSQGNSPRAIMSNLSGTVFVNFQDGAIRGLNVAQMIRSLTASTLSGWQEGKEQTTDLSQLSASFRIDKGQATSSDLNLVGPLVKMTGAGTIDLAAKTLTFRVEPKLVMTTEGQGRAADPVGLGVPVLIEGPWAEPRIYPEMAGILDNPDAGYAKLKEMGKGLFGAGGGGLGGLLGGLGGAGSAGSGGSGGQADQLGKIGETLGNLFGQGFSQGRGIPAQPSPAPAAPDASAPPAAAQSDPPPQSQDSQPMNDVLRQLFNR
jgi:AsmA protein